MSVSFLTFNGHQPIVANATFQRGATQGLVRRHSINAANAYWSKWRICPACRGYDLERKNCNVCNHKGVIPKASPIGI